MGRWRECEWADGVSKEGRKRTLAWVRDDTCHVWTVELWNYVLGRHCGTVEDWNYHNGDGHFDFLYRRHRRQRQPAATARPAARAVVLTGYLPLALGVSDQTLKPFF